MVYLITFNDNFFLSGYFFETNKNSNIDNENRTEEVVCMLVGCTYFALKRIRGD